MNFKEQEQTILQTVLEFGACIDQTDRKGLVKGVGFPQKDERQRKTQFPNMATIDHSYDARKLHVSGVAQHKRIVSCAAALGGFEKYVDSVINGGARVNSGGQGSGSICSNC